jgi:hypothetical protein
MVAAEVVKLAVESKEDARTERASSLMGSWPLNIAIGKGLVVYNLKVVIDVFPIGKFRPSLIHVGCQTDDKSVMCCSVTMK